MGLLTSDKSIARRGLPSTSSLQLVPTTASTLRKSNRSVVAICVCVMASFAGGFAASRYWRRAPVVEEVKAQIADFHIVLPQGQTVVTITNLAQNEQYARLEVERNGDFISGVPQIERRIAPRPRLSLEDSEFFRKELKGVVSSSDSNWDKANKIRQWLSATAQRIALPGLSSRVPRQAYEQMRQGQPVLCGNLADIYAALCEAEGLIARPVGLGVLVQNGLYGADTHAAAEVWLPEMGGWIYEDPTFNCYWQIAGKPASALALHEALMEGELLRFAPHTKATEAKLRANYIDPRLYFRQISYEYKPGGQVLYYADKRLEPLSMSDANWVHTNQKLDIQRLDTDGNVVLERRGQIAPGIYAQLFGNDLFIRDRREVRSGMRVRSSSGMVEGCAYIHQRAEQLGLFNGLNLARNPSFRSTQTSNDLADEWSVVGPVEIMTVSGGQAMAALAGGKLWQRIQARPHGRYLFYARVSVVRGLVNWSIGDAERGPKSTGSIEPERISEVVSDVVESDTGYLDIGFSVPSGGAFRVLDVIVTEAPRFESEETIAGEAKRQVALERR
ncbi:MAG TPA: transglutaminase-like domain-containing protein [Pyrinomonadaceae bacterium]|nr:transglutaminase-like domain-containing protein [Pyrinomonadaceae bacterium]